MSDVACVLSGYEMLRPKTLPLRHAANTMMATDDRPDIDCRPGAAELLLQWPAVRALVVEAATQLRSVFGRSAGFALERFDDPEAEEPTTQLYLLVCTSEELSDAMAALRRFDEQWWIDNVPRAQGRLVIDLEPA